MVAARPNQRSVLVLSPVRLMTILYCLKFGGGGAGSCTYYPRIMVARFNSQALNLINLHVMT
jgi:hypothetical protein